MVLPFQIRHSLDQQASCFLSATDIEINKNVDPICVGLPLIALSKLIKDLSTDYEYKIVSAIQKGVLPTKLGLLEIGSACNSQNNS